MSKRPTLTKALSHPNYVLTSFWKEKNLERRDFSLESPPSTVPDLVSPSVSGDWIEQRGLSGVWWSGGVEWCGGVRA